jgi:hypothetical protein
MEKRKRVAVLPTKLVKEIESLGLSDLLKARAFKAIGLIMKRCLNEEGSLDRFTGIPVEYWKKVLGAKYERVLFPLEFNVIIQRPKSYSTKWNVCKKCRINPELLNDDSITVSFEDDKKEKDNSYECKETRKVLRELQLDFRNAQIDVETYIQTRGFLEKVKFDVDIADSKNLQVWTKADDGEWDKHFYSRDLAIMYARQAGKMLIQEKQEIFIEYKNVFLHNKRVQIRYSYIGALERFKNKEFYAKITKTNGRLDSNLTTMPSRLLKYFTLEGEHLVGLDLKNSQFVFLASIIEGGLFHKYIQAAQKMLQKSKMVGLKNPAAEKALYSKTSLMIGNGGMEIIEEREGRGERRRKLASTYMCAKSVVNEGVNEGLTLSFSSDLQQFLELAKNGNLYEYIRDELGLRPNNYKAGRAEAKQMMFEIFFSKHNARSEAKTRITSLFPTLIEMIKLFKQEHGDNQFAIALQKKESEIFIGKILPELFRQGFKVLTKHDSVLCKRSDKDRVEAVMRLILDEDLGEYQLKPDYLYKD